jgi:hypothetical protein
MLMRAYISNVPIVIAAARETATRLSARNVLSSFTAAELEYTDKCFIAAGLNLREDFQSCNFLGSCKSSSCEVCIGQASGVRLVTRFEVFGRAVLEACAIDFFRVVATPVKIRGATAIG